MATIKFTTRLILLVAIIYMFQLHPASSINKIEAATKPKVAFPEKVNPLHRRVFVGEDVKVPCLTERAKSMYSVGANATYAWSQGKDSNALGVRYAMQPNGDLYIKNLVASDSQILTCKVLAKNAETLEFKHQLAVVAVPDVEVGLILQYNGDKCISVVKDIIKQKIQVLVEEPICQKGKICQINKIIVTCLKADVGVKYQITLKTGVRSKLNYTCTEDCPKPPEGQGPTQVRKSLHELFMKQAIEIPERKLEYKAPKIHDKEETRSCMEGFILKFQICKPCAPGSYQRNIKECERCPENTYSEFYAATECQKCPKNEVTVGDGRDSASYCIEFDAVAIVIVFILFFIIFIVIPCCCPCAFVFYRYRRRTIAETGQEPKIIQNIQLIFSVAKGIIQRLTSKEEEQETSILLEDQVPLLIGGDVQEIGSSIRDGGSSEFATVPQTAAVIPLTSTSFAQAAAATLAADSTVPQVANAVPQRTSAVPLVHAPVISVQPAVGTQPAYPAAMIRP